MILCCVHSPKIFTCQGSRFCYIGMFSKWKLDMWRSCIQCVYYNELIFLSLEFTQVLNCKNPFYPTSSSLAYWIKGFLIQTKTVKKPLTYFLYLNTEVSIFTATQLGLDHYRLTNHKCFHWSIVWFKQIWPLNSMLGNRHWSHVDDHKPLTVVNDDLTIAYLRC